MMETVVACAAQDPRSTGIVGDDRIEELIEDLRDRHTVVIITHNLQQAARVSRHMAFCHLGERFEHGETSEISSNPRECRTQDYVGGRYG